MFRRQFTASPLLPRIISYGNICDQRRAFIRHTTITVNNKLIEPGFKVTDQDVVKVDGEIIRNRTKSFTYIAFNKPKGIVCTTDTKREEKNIIDFITNL